ncbi:DUF2243 domain-containing protein [soil metagenome]
MATLVDRGGNGTVSWSGAVIGFGLGGFVDGIVLHQIMQWHNMGSAVVPPTTMMAMTQNMVWDGWFHAATWIVSFIGVWILWSHARQGRLLPSGGAFAGQMLFGWGLFNLIEGVIDHHLLDLHHVRDMPVHVPVYDWMFLGVAGVLFTLIGWFLARIGCPRHPTAFTGESAC